MKPILIIAPHAQIAHSARIAVEKYDNVDVELGLLKQAIEIGHRAESGGVEVLISRGGTAQMLQQEFPMLPVVEIPVSPYDVLHALHQAKTYGENMTVLGFKNMLDGVEQVGPILDLNLTIHYIQYEQEAEEYLKQRSSTPTDVLLGGVVAEQLAQKYAIPTVPIQTGVKTIDACIKEAQNLIQVRRQERRKTEQANAILQYINEGIIAVDHEGKVCAFNTAASKITEIDPNDILGKVITDVIPESKLVRVMQQNACELGQLQTIGNNTILTNRVPIYVNEKTVGAVATFENITKIQKDEHKIRTQLMAKGHIAKYTFEEILGNSPSLQLAKEKARKYANVESTILIIGESGTGKEMFAQSIHQASQRQRGPFVAVNCAAIPDNLLESELFGYEEGAFTGALRKGKPGLFTLAHRGTIFLDEIAEIPLDLQARLLRVLQEWEVRPLGSDKVIPINVRVIAATNRHLWHEVECGNFRQDLFYRLNVLHLRLPTLQERQADIPLLCQFFAMKFATKFRKEITFSQDAIDLLATYHWPGNIRELENVVERLIVLGDHLITAADVHDVLEESSQQQQRYVESLETAKQQHILKILKECQGNQTVAAEKLGISRTHLWRILKKCRPCEDVT